MPESGGFTGAGFSLESLTLPATATLRLKYTQDPLAASPSGAHDALNPTNYTITGPNTVVISVINGTSGSTQSVDIQLAAPLPTGTYTVSVANVQTAGAAPLTAPTQLSITVTFTGNPDPISGGAVTDSAQDIFRKHLSKALQGPNWTALIASVTTGDTTNFTNGALAFNQLFRSTASGLYLDRKLGDDGIRRPTGIGMSDATFSQYGIAINAHKLTQNSFLDTLEIFYGSAAVRAHADTVSTAPFGLSGGEVLNLLVDELIPIIATFASADFAKPGQATAMEVAASLTRAFELNDSDAYAIPLQDPVTGLNRVRIYSGTHGLSSAIRITSGLANTVLQFPLQIVTPPLGTTPSTVTWTISVPTPGLARWTVSSGAVDLSQIRVNDYVNIIGANFLAVNRGSFIITNVNVTYTGGTTLLQYFDVINPTVSAQGPIAEINLSDVFFFRPTKQSIQAASGRTVVVGQEDEKQVDVQIPATTIAVTRTANIAAYLEVNNAISTTFLSRTSSIVGTTTAGYQVLQGVVTVVAPSHGLSVGNQIYVDGVYGNPSVTNNLMITPYLPATSFPTQVRVTCVATTNIIAPDNSLNGVAVITDSASGNTDYFVESAALSQPANTIDTFSVYVKAGTQSFVTLTPDGNPFPNYVAIFSLTGIGSVAYLDSHAISAAIQALSGGWYRCSVTASVVSASPQPTVLMAANGTSTGYNFTGTGTNTIYIWGPQFEKGSSATTYNPAPSPFVAGNQSSSGNPGTADSSLLTIASLVRAPDILNTTFHTATLQTDGKVLVVGGLNTDSQTAGAGTQSACDRFTLTGSSVLAGGQTQWTYNWINTASLPSTTNFMERSQLMTNAVWTQTRETTTAAVGVTGPDGNTTNVFKIADDATASSTHQTSQTYTPNSTGLWCNSVYARAGSLTWIVVSTDNGTTFVYFNLAGAGTVGSVGGGALGFMTPVGFGWYRCYMFSPLISGVGKTASYGLATANNTQSFNGGGGTNFVYLWGPQVEAGGYPTNYVPTPASATASAPNALQWHQALVAVSGPNNGNTLTFGGYNNNNTPTPAFFSPAMYSYNGSGNTWTPLISNLITPRCIHNIGLLPTGQILIAGGASTPTNATATSEILAADQSNISAGPTLNEARAGAAALTLSNGNLLVIGGQALANPAYNDANVLAYWPFNEMDTGFTAADSSANAFNLTDIASLTLADAGGKIAFCRNFSAGGHMTAAGSGTVITDLLGSWTIEAWVDGISAGTLNQQQVILSYEGAAGAGGNGNILAQLWVEQQTSNILVGWTWQNGTNLNVTSNVSLPTPVTTYKWHHIAISKLGTTVLTYFDGVLVSTSLGNANATGGSTSIWHVGLGNQSTGQFKGRIDDMRVSFIPRSPVEIYRTWINGRGDLSLVLSSVPPPNLGALVASIETGNAASWKIVGNMSIARAGHRAVLLPNGRVLICGGYGYTNRQPLPTTLQSSTEIWDPNTRTCQPAGNMVVARAYHTAVYLASINKVLVLGGYTASTNNSPIFEYYDLNNNTWSEGVTALQTAGSLDGGPFTNDAIAVAMTGGPVLVTGGKSRSGVATPMEIMVFASDQIEAGSANGIYTVATVPNSNTFTFSTPSTSSYTLANSGISITPMGAIFSSIPGPFIYDTKGGIGITSIATTLSQNIFQGQQYATLAVASSAAFPDAPGWLCIGFGYSYSTFPVKYLGRFSATALSLDYSFIFPQNVSSGATVTLLNGSGIYVPSTPTTVGSFYLTDSNSGRVAAQSTIQSIDGAGLNINISVIYPGDIGLGGAGLGATGQKFSDEVLVWGSNSLDVDEFNARGGKN